jgi:hypothetical protein
MKLDEIYRSLEEGVSIKENPKYASLVNFGENKNLPRHRWFNIKEGFSSEIIKELIKKFDGKEDDLVFDPFSGSGTTVLSAKELGIPSFGIEVNPFLWEISKSKLIEGPIDLSKHISFIENINPEKNICPPKLSISQKLFGKQLKNVLAIKEYISSVKNNQERQLLKTAFLCSLEISSSAKKDGNGLKYPKNKKPAQIKEVIIEKIRTIQEDINQNVLDKEVKSLIFNEDVRDLESFIREKHPEYIDKTSFCLFSPPYMNCFDYTEIYKIELWFGDFIEEYSDLKKLREKSLDSHLNKKLFGNRKLNDKTVNFFYSILEEKELWSKKIPKMIEGYFEDMWKTLNGIYLTLKKGGVCVIVVGNSSYGNVVIPTDLILGKIGLHCGFKKCSIEIARRLGTSSQQLNKVNKPELLRESLVILKK